METSHSLPRLKRPEMTAMDTTTATTSFPVNPVMDQQDRNIMFIFLFFLVIDFYNHNKIEIKYQNRKREL